MATRGAIAIASGNELRGVYVHWDAYLSGVGRKLIEHWNNRSLVNLLIDQGDISSLGESIGIKHDFDGIRPPGETTFYGRDRGETDVEAEVWSTAEEFVEEMERVGCEFFYIYGWDDQWWVTCAYGPLKGTWTRLEESFQIVREFEF